MVCGTPMRVSAAEYTRPCSSGGVRVCTAVPNATTAQDRPIPAMTNPATTGARTGNRNSESPAPKSRMPIPSVRPSPSRRRTPAAVTAPAMAPTPWATLSTPRNAGGRCRPYWSTAKITDSAKPTTSSAIASAPTIRRSPMLAAMWRAPAATWTRM